MAPMWVDWAKKAKLPSNAQKGGLEAKISHLTFFGYTRVDTQKKIRHSP